MGQYAYACINVHYTYIRERERRREEYYQFGHLERQKTTRYLSLKPEHVKPTLKLIVALIWWVDSLSVYITKAVPSLRAYNIRHVIFSVRFPVRLFMKYFSLSTRSFRNVLKFSGTFNDVFLVLLFFNSTSHLSRLMSMKWLGDAEENDRPCVLHCVIGKKTSHVDKIASGTAKGYY